MAISSPLLETSINGARGVLINVTGSMDIGLEEVETAANLVQEAAYPDANIIFGAAFDETLEDEIRVTVIATGFEENQTVPFPNQVETPAPTPEAASAAPEEEAVSPAGAEAPAVEQPAVPEPPKPAVNDDDWDILEKIFSKKR